MMRLASPARALPVLVLALAALHCSSSSSSSSASKDAGSHDASRDSHAAKTDAGCAKPIQGGLCVDGVPACPSTGACPSTWSCQDGNWYQAIIECVAEDADTGCVTPVLSSPCNPSARLCKPNPECGIQWTCAAESASGDGGTFWQELDNNCVVYDAAMHAADAGLDAGKDASHGDLDGSVSVSSCAKCGVGEMCVVSILNGGACIRPDGDTCSNGATGGCCNTHTSYACQNLPAACADGVTCSCAGSLCGATGEYQCQPGPDASTPGNVLTCVADAP